MSSLRKNLRTDDGSTYDIWRRGGSVESPLSPDAPIAQSAADSGLADRLRVTFAGTPAPAPAYTPGKLTLAALLSQRQPVSWLRPGGPGYGSVPFGAGSPDVVYHPPAAQPSDLVSRISALTEQQPPLKGGDYYTNLSPAGRLMVDRLLTAFGIR